MKQKNREKRLEARQKDYDAAVSRLSPKERSAVKRPGSLNK